MKTPIPWDVYPGMSLYDGLVGLGWLESGGTNVAPYIAAGLLIWCVAGIVVHRLTAGTASALTRNLYRTGGYIFSYLFVGYFMLAATLCYALPTTALLGRLYLCAVWPFWLAGYADIPAWLAPYLFD